MSIFKANIWEQIPNINSIIVDSQAITAHLHKKIQIEKVFNTKTGFKVLS